mmetsp:Transcript_70393/g.139641  ORF Transcript_70393/g.139641 Transcript_70393/m.139641 type:complete len:412 (+) Transcript_70393:49-1284(+)
MADYIIYTKDLSLQAARAAEPVRVLQRKPLVTDLGCFSVAGSDCAVEEHAFSSGRGLRVRRPVKAGEAVLTVPLHHCWSAERARQVPELASLASLPDEDLMALHLLLERAKGPTGWNATHLRILPEEYDMTPFWSDSELARLDGELQATSRKLATQVQTDFAAIIKTAQGKGEDGMLLQAGIDLESFKWAKATLWSRCTDLSVKKDAAPQRFLVPGFDLANCDQSLPVAFCVSETSVILKAAKDLQEGEELCINYGPHPNNHLLLWYGFVIDENPCTSITIEFPVDAAAAGFLESLGAQMRDAEPGSGRVTARCQPSFRDPIPCAMLFAAAVCNGICALGQTSLNVEQELAALELLTKILPPASDVQPLPQTLDHRQRCALVLLTADDRVLATVHSALQRRRVQLNAKPKK